MNETPNVVAADPIQRWEELTQASAAITVALCHCQRAGLPPEITDRLLEAKRDVDQLRGGR